MPSMADPAFTVDWAGAAGCGDRGDAARIRAVLQVPGWRGGAGRRRPRRRRLQRGERELRPRAVRRVRHGLGAARERRRTARRSVLCGRCRGSADAVRAVPATAVGARWAGVPGRPHRWPAQDGRAAAACVRPGEPGSRTRPGGPARALRSSSRAQGTVFVHPDSVGGERVWTAYWERSAGFSDDSSAARGILEEGPLWPDSADAVAWGRARTPRVIVVDADGELYWAGTTDAPPRSADPGPEAHERAAGRPA